MGKWRALCHTTRGCGSNQIWIVVHCRTRPGNRWLPWASSASDPKPDCPWWIVSSSNNITMNVHWCYLQDRVGKEQGHQGSDWHRACYRCTRRFILHQIHYIHICIGGWGFCQYLLIIPCTTMIANLLSFSYVQSNQLVPNNLRFRLIRFLSELLL